MRRWAGSSSSRNRRGDSVDLEASERVAKASVLFAIKPLVVPIGSVEFCWETDVRVEGIRCFG